MDIITIETSSLGDRSYVVTDGTVAAVVDPQRDIDRVLEALKARGLTLTDVFETHIHNDYVTGGYELARTTGATYHVGRDDQVAFDRHPVGDGDEIVVGGIVIRVVHTPGHTPTHLSFVAVEGGREIAVFTGGSLLYGSVGRTDLIGPDQTETLTRAQYRSAHHLADLLDDDTSVLPTHGFGSFCSSGETSGRDRSTIGLEKTQNQALTTENEDDFVRELLAGLDAYPAYYAHMGPRNRSGPDPVDLSPVDLVDTVELRRRIEAGEWVVDLRSRTAFARDHVSGTVSIELDDSASTYLGWILPWGTPVTLLARTADEVAQMQRQLVRIGIDRPAGQFLGAVEAVGDAAPRRSFRVATFAQAADALANDTDVWLLDARLRREWDTGHIPDAHHVPLHEILDALDQIPRDRPIWVHCESGYRAAIATSLLERAGRDVVLIDEPFADRAPAAFTIVT